MNGVADGLPAALIDVDNARRGQAIFDLAAALPRRVDAREAACWRQAACWRERCPDDDETAR